MATKIFVNLAVKDMDRSIRFFTQLGYSFDQRFTDEKAACLIISEDIYVMLLKQDFFREFTKKKLVDPAKATEAIIALSAYSRDEVDKLFKKAIDAGGSKARETEDMEWMYGQSFEDPDGHIWEVFYMDMAKAPVMAGNNMETH